MDERSQRGQPSDRKARARPHVLALAAALGTVLAIGIAFERSGAVPATLTGHNISMLKYEMLREHVRIDGPNDVLVIGSSAVLSGVVPYAMEARLALRLDSQRRPRVYNFGVQGHNVLTYPFLVKLVLASGDRPRLFVFQLSPRAIDSTAKELLDWAATVEASPYAQALEDEYRLRGRLSQFLLDSWFLRTYAPTLRAQLVGTRLSGRSTRGEWNEGKGFFPSPERDPVAMTRFHQYLLVGNWGTDARFSDALDLAVARARAAGGEVLLIDFPMNPRLQALMKDRQRNLRGLDEYIDAAAQRLDVRVARVPRRLTSRSDFADLTHLTHESALEYSRWLAAEIARDYPELLRD
jgi:hypothetical protein